jgi:hypothetical protein
MCILAGRDSEGSEITFLNGPEELDEDDSSRWICSPASQSASYFVLF